MPVALHHATSPLGGRQVRPRRQERPLARLVHPLRGDLGQFGQLLLSGQSELQARGPHAQPQEGPVIDQHDAFCGRDSGSRTRFSGARALSFGVAFVAEQDNGDARTRLP